MTPDQPQAKTRSRKMYILWAIALALLLSLGAFCWLVVVPVWKMDAVPRPRFEASDRHYVRSDDFGEYHGLHLYTLAQDGRLYYTNYPDEMKGAPSLHKRVGGWQEQDDKLTWSFTGKPSRITYAKDKKGVYVEEKGTYYVPVTLMPVAIRDCKPQVGHTRQEKR